MMKKYMLLLFLSALGSCVIRPTMYMRTYSIENATDVPVKFSFYNDKGHLLSVGVGDRVLMPSDRLKGSWIDSSVDLSTLPQSEREGLPSSSFRSADSVQIVFDGQRRLSYTVIGISEFSEPLNRNLFRDSNYESIGNDDFLYKITQADYENAEDCDGDCN